MGHEGVDVHEKTYVHVPLPTLKEAVETLDFRPLLNLSVYR